MENSIDARARNITIIRGRERGEPYLRVVDDGEGIRLNDAGVPDFDYVATHVCDSVKRRLKARGATGIQGEFGIGLLSFWTAGERLVLSSAGADGRVHDMEMIKEEPHYKVTKRRLLFSQPGTELLVKPLLPGIRQLNPERENFPGYERGELLERMIELSLYAEEHLRIRPTRELRPRESQSSMASATLRLRFRFSILRLDSEPK